MNFCLIFVMSMSRSKKEVRGLRCLLTFKKRKIISKRIIRVRCTSWYCSLVVERNLIHLLSWRNTEWIVYLDRPWLSRSSYWWSSCSWFWFQIFLRVQLNLVIKVICNFEFTLVKFLLWDWGSIKWVVGRLLSIIWLLVSWLSSRKRCLQSSSSSAHCHLTKRVLFVLARLVYFKIVLWCRPSSRINVRHLEACCLRRRTCI